MNVGDTDAVFLSLQVTRLSVRAIQNIVKKYAQTAAPLKKISPHKLRSTFGTNLYRATGDIYLVADVLGHRDVNTTKSTMRQSKKITENSPRKSSNFAPTKKINNGAKGVFLQHFDCLLLYNIDYFIIVC